MNREVFSRIESSKDNWETPPYFIQKLEELLGVKFTLDPCASDTNHKAPKYYTEITNGLKQDWSNERVFVNPPYSNIAEWCKKCSKESIGANMIALLIPARTDTKYFHEYCLNSTVLLFCKGRVNFLLNGQKPKNGSTFPSIVVIWSNTNTNMNDMDGCCMSFDHRGDKK